MRIRLYYGYDCNSVEGFNNGQYLGEEFEVESRDAAYDACEKELAKRWNITSADLEDIEQGFQFTTGYYDDFGDEMTQSVWMKANENKEFGSYSYVYVSFEEI